MRISLKKDILLTLVCLLSNILTYAQKGLNLEVIAQPGIAMGGDFKVQTDYNHTAYVSMGKALTFGINSGVAVGYSFTEKFGISFGALYSLQGQHYKDYKWPSSTYYGIDALKKNITLNYINIPLQFNLVLSPEKKVSFICSGGFYFGVLLGYQDKKTATYSYSSITSRTLSASGLTYTQTDVVTSGELITTNIPITGRAFNSFDFGGIVSAGFQFKLSDKLFIPLTFNYQAGFIDIKNYESKYTVTSTNKEYLYWQGAYADNPNATIPYRNSALGLRMGLKIKL